MLLCNYANKTLITRYLLLNEINKVTRLIGKVFHALDDGSTSDDDINIRAVSYSRNPPHCECSQPNLVRDLHKVFLPLLLMCVGKAVEANEEVLLIQRYNRVVREGRGDMIFRLIQLSKVELAEGLDRSSPVIEFIENL